MIGRSRSVLASQGALQPANRKEIITQPPPPPVIKLKKRERDSSRHRVSRDYAPPNQKLTAVILGMEWTVSND
jgi:hypothetical protein